MNGPASRAPVHQPILLVACGRRCSTPATLLVRCPPLMRFAGTNDHRLPAVLANRVNTTSPIPIVIFAVPAAWAAGWLAKDFHRSPPQNSFGWALLRLGLGCGRQYGAVGVRRWNVTSLCLNLCAFVNVHGFFFGVSTKPRRGVSSPPRAGFQSFGISCRRRRLCHSAISAQVGGYVSSTSEGCSVV